MELWDLLDQTRRPLGATHRRGDPLRPDEYHVVVEVWTVNSAGEVLLTLRAPEKDAYPGKWENTGGSVLAGETSLQGAVRELFEETGIRAGEDELLYLETAHRPSVFLDTYLLRRDVPLSALLMQAGETVAARWAALPQIDALIAHGELAEPVRERYLRLRRRLEELAPARIK